MQEQIPVLFYSMAIVNSSWPSRAYTTVDDLGAGTSLLRPVEPWRSLSRENRSRAGKRWPRAKRCLIHVSIIVTYLCEAKLGNHLLMNQRKL